MSRARTERVGRGVAAALGLAPAVYVAASAVERAMQPTADPAAVLWAERSPFLGWLAVTGYGTALAAAGLVALAARFPARSRHLVAAACGLGALAAALRAAGAV